MLREDQLGFGDLVDREIKVHSGEWDWKIKFFDNAKQDHTRLGNFKGWVDKNKVEFKDGDTCWQGPGRSLTVTFVCGMEEAILDVTEPSRCVYAATVRHPGACDIADLQEIEKPAVIHPRDEL